MIHLLLFVFLVSQAQATEPPIPPEAVTLLQSGVDAENRRDIDTAIVDFRKATEVAPSASIAYLRLGDAFMRKGDYSSALPPLRRAAELNPNSLPAHQLLGFALLAQGYAAEAIPHLERIHEYGALGIAQLQIGQPSEAVKNLQEALKKTPDDPDLLYYLSRATTALSSQSLDKLLSSFSTTARGHQAIAQNYYAMKMYPEAKKEFDQAITLRPDLPGLRMELGEVYAAGSEWEKAEEQFRAESNLQPGNAEVAYRLGDALLQQGKMKDAAEELQRSDALRPDMPETLYALGKAEAVANPTQAEKSLQRVTELEKDTPLAAQAYLVLAGIHRKQAKADLSAHEMQEYRRIQSLNEPRTSGKP